MKMGYSILLGEYVQASALEHKDCEHFQVVCPACKEPVFKVAQKWQNAIRHYLSHYRADRSHASDCEMRVSRLTGQEISRVNALSRDQKLSLFLGVLQSAVLKTMWGSRNRNPVRKAIRDMQGKNHLAFLRDVTFNHLETDAFLKDFDPMVETYYGDAGRPETAFAEMVQRRIARDMFGHVLSQNARRSYDFLFNSSLLHLVGRMEAAEEAGTATAASRQLHYYAAHLMLGNEKEGKKLVVEALDEIAYPPFVEAPMSYLVKLTAEVHHEMIGTLLRLPYFEILRENLAHSKSKRPNSTTA